MKPKSQKVFCERCEGPMDYIGEAYHRRETGDYILRGPNKKGEFRIPDFHKSNTFYCTFCKRTVDIPADPKK